MTTASRPNPPLRTVAIVGTGVMGTSVALALRDRGIRIHLLDWDSDAARTAATLGAGIAEIPDRTVDLAVLAVPPRHVAAALAEQQADGLAQVYTDVSSVKSAPLADAEALGCDLSCYVGGHPIAGSERSGPLAASGTLFRDRAWVLTYRQTTATTAVDRVTELVQLCGARAVTHTEATHDRILARTSHVPHLIASLLAGTLADADDQVLELCGNGIRDATRIAAGDSALWTDILRANATEVAQVLAEFAADLTAASSALMTGSTVLTDLLARGNSGRSALLAG